MPKACENCPEELLLNHTIRRRQDILQSIDWTEAEIERCTRGDIFSGRKRSLKDSLHHLHSLQSYYEECASPEVIEAAETCSGPYERTEDMEDDSIYRQRVCGARIINHIISGARIDKLETT